MEHVGVGVFGHGRDQGQGLAGWGDAGRGSESVGWWAWRGAMGVEMAAAHRSRAGVPGIVAEGGVELDRVVGSSLELHRDGFAGTQQPLLEDGEPHGLHILRQWSNTG